MADDPDRRVSFRDEAPLQERAAPEKRPPLHLLLAEENPENERVVVRLLEKAGHRVDIVRDGREAVETAGGGRFDAILMDVELPQIDGYEATRTIRSREVGTRRVPIIALTAIATNGDHERCLAAGMDDSLAKPIRVLELYRTLERWVAAARAQGSAEPEGANASCDSDASMIVQRLRELGIPRDAAVVSDLVRMFLEDTERILEQLDDAVGLKDSAACERLAHAVRGASLNLGAKGLAGLARELEEGAARGETSDARPRLGAMRQALQRLHALMGRGLLTAAGS